jgi:hypothetical protein
MKPCDYVRLDVGGQLFHTTHTTLTNIPHTFFSGLGQAEGEVFIDRDPTHFRILLNWLRGSTALPWEHQALQELREEASFFCVSCLLAAIDQRLLSTPRSVAHAVKHGLAQFDHVR